MSDLHEQMDLKIEEEGQQLKIICHEGDAFAERFYPGEKRPRWDMRPATGVGLGDGMRGCSYCGSMHPQDLYDLKDLQTLRMHWADFKYGYPHKLYIEGIPNPMAGQEVVIGSRSYTNHETGENRKENITGKSSDFIRHKFYTVHMLDVVEETELFVGLASMVEARTGIYMFMQDGKLYFKKSPFSDMPPGPAC